MSTHSGKVVGRYRLLEAVGRGGMAEVYRGRDERLERTVAVKVILPVYAQDPEFRDRFLREARLIAALEHPNILPVYDFGEEQGLSYLVTPFLDRGTLDDRLARGPLPPATVASYARQLAGALDAAHAAGILHRDVKPANVLVGNDGRLVLSDFGIAKLLDSSTRLTQTGVVVGTPVYMAPELARGEEATPATDLYALACLTYQMLAGAPPFRGETALALMHQHVNEPVPPLGGELPGVTAELDLALARGLAKEPQQRPGSCTAFAMLLAGGPDEHAATAPLPVSVSTAAETAPTLATPASPLAGQAPAGARRRGVALALGALTIVVLAWLTVRYGLTGGEEAVRPPGGVVAEDEAAVPPPLPENPSEAEGEPLPEAADDDSGVGSEAGPAPETASPLDQEPRPVNRPSPPPPQPSPPPAPASPGGAGRGPAAARPALEGAAPEVARFLLGAERTLLGERPECIQFDGLAARASEAVEMAADGGASEVLGALKLYAEGGRSYCAGDDADASRRLAEIADSMPRATEILGPLRYAQVGRDLEPWQLALAYGDPRREAEDLLAASQSETPATALARAYLAHLDGDHDRAADLAEALLAERQESDPRRSELLLLAAEERLHGGDVSAAAGWLRQVETDRLSVRRVLRRLELWAGQDGLRKACDAGYRPACQSPRRGAQRRP